ncbi:MULTISPECIES: hypothetical protein [unclassified Streptomyces]|uniref:hypothetical protein n=1 Tax=unclassified Streptomyces TaxID=2593676 RepID=UPI00342C3B30
MKARFAEILADQLNPQDVIDKMVEIIGAEHGKYRTVWPPATEELIKEVQEAAWTRRCDPAPSPGARHARHAGTADRQAVDQRAEQVAAQICSFATRLHALRFSRTVRTKEPHHDH